MVKNIAQVKTILLVCCGQGFNREYQGHYNRYKVIIDGQPIEKIYSASELKDLAYWSPRSKVMAMTTWGQSQEFEAVIKLARFLGIGGTFVEVNKNWSEFCLEASQRIKVIY